MQPEFMYPAAEAGEVDVISAYTSDGRIARHDLVVLDDPKQAIPPYDAIVLVSPKRANDRAMLDALRPLVGAIDVDADARGEPARDRARRCRPAGVARWLWAEIERRIRAEKMIARPRIGRAITLFSHEIERQLTSSSTIRSGRSR